MLAPEKSPGIKFCCQFQKVGARKVRCHNLFVQNCSSSRMQIVSLVTLWSHDTVVLLLVTCQKGKLLHLLWSFLLYWTFCLIWDHFHTENETETSWEQPEVYLQRVNKEWFRTSVTDCDLSWLTRKYFDSRWYLLFHGLLSACYRYEDLIYLYKDMSVWK